MRDRNYRSKAKGLQWVTPKQIGVPDSDRVFKPYFWSIATEKFKKIGYAKTPAQKIHTICQTVTTIELAFSLIF